jgi:glycosyltransferase involved in cell wall biosynthesis
MPKVSILMPCFNVAETLIETLESIQAQTYHDFEVVAVDDGSEDATPKILAQWTEKDVRFKPLHLEHGGIIPALNAGLNACQGEYIARMDADDLMRPERLEKQVAYLDAYPDVTLISSLVEGFPEKDLREGFRIYIQWLNSLVSHEDICREMFVEGPICHPSVMFRKQSLVELGGYQENGWPEDYDLWLRMYLAGHQFAKLPEVFLAWREHPHRLTRTDSRYSVENFIRAKAHYLPHGPLKDRDAVILWGAGMMGRRTSKHLIREGVPLVAFIDIDPKKIGGTLRSLPIISPGELPDWWSKYQRPALLAAVGARGARQLIRERLTEVGFVEGEDWWGIA